MTILNSTSKDTVINLLEKGKFISLIETRTGKNNIGNQANRYFQLYYICRKFNLNINDYIYSISVQDIKPKTNFHAFIKYLKSQDECEIIYTRTELHVSKNSFAYTLLRLYEMNIKKLYKNFEEMYLC